MGELPEADPATGWGDAIGVHEVVQEDRLDLLMDRFPARPREDERPGIQDVTSAQKLELEPHR